MPRASVHDSVTDCEEWVATLTIKGWARVEELRRSATGSRKGFMAMKFGDPQLDAVFREHFKLAVTQAGFDLMRLAPHTREFEPTLVSKCKPEFRRDLVAFDWWVHNADRTLGDYSGNPNLLWDTEAGVPVVIDHNMAFDSDFEPVKFLESHIFRADLTALKSDLVMRAEYEQRFSSLVPLLDDIWAELPQNWVETEDGDIRFLQTQFFLVLDRVNHPQFWSSP